jgi:hypothetical protein
MGDEYYDEVTRCLGDYDYNHPDLGDCFYPEALNRYKIKAQGGCDGWYNPLDGNFSTPDYLNRNVSGDRARVVDVPNNYYNNFGVGVNHRQEPFDDDDDNQVNEGEEDAYIGIWNVRCLNNPSNNYAEYVTQRFSDGNHLKPNHKYLIRFRVSWTDGIVDNIERGQTGHYLKGIGAYFSVTDPFENRRQNNRPLDLNDNTEGLIYNADYNSSNSATYYNNTGGEDGKHWDIVENYYQPTEDKYFITIGNFKNIWIENIDFKGPAIPDDSYINIYYFIDAVEVIEVDFSCTCESANAANVYDISIVPKLKDPNSNECCFDVFLTVAELLYNYDICYVNRAKIYEVVDEPYEEKYKGIFELEQGYFHQTNNIKIFENLCFIDSETTPKKLKVYLYQGYETKCIIIKQFIVSCPCGCEPEPPPYKVNITKINYSQNSGKTSCCWDLAVSNESDCNFSLKEIFAEFDDAHFNNIHIDLNSGWDAELLNRENGKSKYKFTKQGSILLPTEEGQPIKFGKICVDWNTPPTQIKFTYSNSEGLCDREINLDFKCEDCCGKVHTNIQSSPSYDDGTSCCFTFIVEVEPGALCGVKKVQVFDIENHFLWESQEGVITEGVTNHTFCVKKSVFRVRPGIFLSFQYLDDNNNVLCSKGGLFIEKCREYPIPCTPDNEGTGFSPPVTTTIFFDCGVPPVPCAVTFTYTYRHVKNGPISVHRDLQVLSYNFPTGCNCEEERVNRMLLEMWSNPDVISNFELNDVNWQLNTQKCFTNFRVISADCWEISNTYPVQYTKKCNNDVCCYATYRVCYIKKSFPPPFKIEFVSYQKLSENDIVPIQCISPCDERNCHIWRPSEGGGISGRNGTSEFEDNKYKNCIVFLTSNNYPNEFSMNIECTEKGKISYSVYDLLGNAIIQGNEDKKEYSISIPLYVRIIQGIYFVKVNLDNNLLYTDKIFILK